MPTLIARSAYKILIAASLAGLCACSGGSDAEEVDIPIAESIKVKAPDAKAEAIVLAATTFLQTLTPEQRKAVVFPFTDNAQRARWSNFPAGMFERMGLVRGDLNPQQNAAFDVLLAEVLSENGVRNARLQMVADDALKGQGPAGGLSPNFGSAYYYVSFLGQPSTDAPWTMQFGGHHLAINATFAGPEASFSPMLTGGQPMTVTFEGKKVYITQAEVEAARAFLLSLDAKQKAAAIRGTESIQLVLGPGEHGTTIAPEGIIGSSLSEAQKQLLLAVIHARVGHLNTRDSDAKMAEIKTKIDKTYFAWWGPEQPRGKAYYRVTGPSIVLEYSPQIMADDDPSEHAHNMYRDPTNDYGARWIRTGK